MKLHRSLALLLCAVSLTACEKNAVQDITGTLPGARILFFNWGVSAPQVNFYANDTKITAIFSTTGSESNVGIGYAGVGAGGRYSAIEPGPYTFSGRIAAAVDKDLPISTFAATLENGKSYSYFQSGVYNTTSKTVEAFVIEDPYIDRDDFSTAYVRFVNAIANSNPLTLYITGSTPVTAETAVGGPVAYKSGSAFVAVPNGVYSLATRTTGSATNTIVRTGVSFVAGRIYTIGARGDITVTSTTAATRPILDFSLNR